MQEKGDEIILDVLTCPKNGEFEVVVRLELLGHEIFFLTFRSEHGPRYITFVTPFVFQGRARVIFMAQKCRAHLSTPFSFRRKFERPIFI